MRVPDRLGLYISIPFCKAKCTFCNFASDVFAPERMQQYVERVCEEIRATRVRSTGLGAVLPGGVDTLYFGGGTPSLLTAGQMRQIFAAVRGEFAVAGDAEITLECAPGQLEEATLAELLRQGMNRVSLGVQSYVDRESAAVGRLHTAVQCVGEVARLRSAGVSEINVDLIAGLPHQTAESWRYSVEQAVASGVAHVSVYMLEVDEDSRLGREVLEGGGRYGAAAVPTEDDCADFYEVACAALEAGGVSQYEISNFARAGHASRHNVKYWRREAYLGFGLDAHSMLQTATGAVRFANGSELDAYMAAGGPFRMLGGQEEVADFVTRHAAFEEALFLGLRMNDGVRLEDLRVGFGAGLVEAVGASVEELCGAGLMQVEGGVMQLTGRGRMASNEVFSRLLVGEMLKLGAD